MHDTGTGLPAPSASAGQTKRIGTGVLFGALAGATWGLVFLAPALAHDFTPWQLAAGRYLAYGIIAAALLLPRWRHVVSPLRAPHWRALVVLSLLGNIVYYVLLANAVQLGGIAMTSLVIGFLPVAVTVIGSRRAGAVPLARLWPSLLLGAAGIVCISWASLDAAATAGNPLAIVGFVCAIGALASWSTYAVLNSRWLERLPSVSANDWSLLTGLVTGLLALSLALPAFVLPDLSGHDGSAWLRYLGVCAGMAIFSSIIGNAFWNGASRLLPLTLVGQMVLFETLFALLYGFLWETRWPTMLEWLAIGLVVASVPSCVRVHRQPTAARH